MDSLAGKSQSTNTKTISRKAFVVATGLAIIVAVLLIILGQLGYSKNPLFPSHSGFVIDTGSAPPPDSALPNGSSSPLLPTYINAKGSTDAPVTIVIYSDFQCYYCQQFALTTEKELERLYLENGKVRFLYKHFIVHGEESLLAAQASECAAEQNKFWPYYNLLIQTQASPQEEDLTVAYLQSLAQKVGLDMTTFNASLESEKYKEKVLRDDAEGRAAGVEKTPTFFINEIKGVGLPPLETWQNLIDELLRMSSG